MYYPHIYIYVSQVASFLQILQLKLCFSHFHHMSYIPHPLKTLTQNSVLHFVICYFYGEGKLAHRPTPNLQDQKFSAACDCLFTISAATLHIWGPSPPSATHYATCGDKGPFSYSTAGCFGRHASTKTVRVKAFWILWLTYSYGPRYRGWSSQERVC
jgi:hypothetical protein